MSVKLRQKEEYLCTCPEQLQYNIYIEISKYQNDSKTSTDNRQHKYMMAEVKLQQTNSL
jgi:hypothetical protein